MAATEQGVSLGARTLRGMLWAYGSYVGGRALVLVSTAVLARLLTPREFGLVAIAITFITLLEAVGDLGLSQALVVAPASELQARAETAFFSSVGLGTLLAGVIAGLGQLAATFFHEPRLSTIVPVLGLNFLLRSLGATHYALAQRGIEFRARAAAELADVLVRGLAGIAMAVAGFGVWSLVLGYLIGTLTRDLVLWVRVPWRPSLSPTLAQLRPMLRFGGTVSAIDVLADINGNVDNLFVGRVLGASALGLYSIAYRLPELLVLNLASVAGDVLFPAFAATDRETIRRAFVVSLRYTLIAGLGLSVGLVLLAHPFVLALFGPRWTGAVDAMRVLSAFALAVTVGVPAGTAYKAIGRPDVVLKMAVPRVALLIPLLAIFVPEGIVAAALCQAGVAVAFDLVGLGLSSRLLAVPARRLWGAAWPALAAAAAAAGVMASVELLVVSPWPALVLGAALGGAAYLGVIALLAPDALGLLRRLAAGRTSVAPTPPGPS